MKHTCKTYDPLCDICDALSCDPDTGWGGFTDHYAGKHFYTHQEQSDYYKDCRKRGENPYQRDDDNPYR
jgi:hypothetical protein